MPGKIQAQATGHAAITALTTLTALTALTAASIPAFYLAVSAARGSWPAFTCLGHSLDYGELGQLSDQVAAWLQYESGLVPGDRVALQLPNLLQFPVLVLGILKAGMVLVNVSPLHTPAELLQQLQDSGARALFVLAHQADAATTILDATGIQQLVVTELFDLHPAPRRLLASVMLRWRKRQAAASACTRQLGLRKVLQRGAHLLRRCGLQAVVQQRDDVALLQYTGGTTGLLKAAMLSHGNLLSNVAQLAQCLADERLPPGSVMVAPLPLSHIYAFTLGLLNGMAQGHHTLLIPDPRDLPALVQALRPWRLSGFYGVNTLYHALCECPGFAALDFSCLRLCCAGGMALSPDVARRWQHLTGCRLLEGYGLSECAPLVCCNTFSDQQAGSVGRPLPLTTLRLVDAQGREVACGQPGEICVKGPQVMLGYWRQAQENAQVFDAEGWFHSGDIGVLDSAGRLCIIDRIKDVIVISGFKVYPNELEEYVCRHPHVSCACAVGIGDDYRKQIKLFVVSTNPLLTAAELIAWCRQGLAPYKVPRQVEFRPQLPLSNVGKVLRKELRETGGREDRNTV
jgi:long-chain acyl-CoA synthetase